MVTQICAACFAAPSKNITLSREPAIINSNNSSTFYKFIIKLKRFSPSPPLVHDDAAKANMFYNFFCSAFTVDESSHPTFPNSVPDGFSLDSSYFAPNFIVAYKYIYVNLKNHFSLILIPSLKCY